MALVDHFTGIDWSGDPGNPSKPGASRNLVLTAAHVAKSDLQKLVTILADLRMSRSLPDNYVFKFSGMEDKIRKAFFSAMTRAPIKVTASFVAKSGWGEIDLQRTPDDRLNDEIASLVQGCPVEYIAGQRIMIDIHPKEKKTTLERAKAAIKSRLRSHGVPHCPDIRACPDSRSDGQIVQIADMFAGAIQDSEGVSGNLLLPVSNQIILLQSQRVAA